MTIELERYGTMPLFQGLEPLDIMRLLKIAKDIVARKDDAIVREGEAGDGFYVIASGAFEVRKRRTSRDPDVEAGAVAAVLARLGEFSFFGETALVTEAPRSATVVCIVEGRLKKFPNDAFERLLAEGDLAAYKVMRNMCRILAERLTRMGERFVAQGPVEK
jgi:CRP-like cAMP-binding protein